MVALGIVVSGTTLLTVIFIIDMTTDKDRNYIKNSFVKLKAVFYFKPLLNVHFRQ
jgi:hypothetical protein